LGLATASSFHKESFEVVRSFRNSRRKINAYNVDLKHTSPNNHFEVSIRGTECTTRLFFENAADYSGNNIKDILEQNSVISDVTACPQIPKVEHRHVNVKAEVIEHTSRNLIFDCKENKKDGILLANIKLSGVRSWNYYSLHTGTVADNVAAYCSQVLSLRNSIKAAVFEETSLRDFNSKAAQYVPTIN
jgi:hypothetical protein